VEVEIDYLRGGDDFAAAHRLQPLEFMQRAMERVRKRAFVAQQIANTTTEVSSTWLASSTGSRMKRLAFRFLTA
jgi:hypothetical protein